VDVFIDGHQEVSDGPEEEVSFKGCIPPTVRGPIWHLCSAAEFIY